MSGEVLRVKPWVRAAVFAAAALTVAAAVRAVHERGVRSGDRELLRVGVEDVARRVRATAANLRAVVEANDATLLTKARAFAKIVEADPSVVDDAGRFAALAATLDVDELHVSDGKGVLVQSLPRSTVGFDMGSNEQSRPFLAALADPSFAFVQEPRPKAVDGTLFQYAGVARRDRPGIIQVGQKASRVEEARKLADVAAIAVSSRLGRNGRVTVEPLEEARHVAKGVAVERIGGERYYVQGVDVAGYRVVARSQVYGSALADDVPFFVLCAAGVLLLLALVVFSVPSSAAAVAGYSRSLAVLFSDHAPQGGGARQGRLRRFVGSPVTLVGAVLFSLVTGLIWVLGDRAAFRDGEELLLTAREDIREAVDSCVDLPLFFLGKAVCKHYGSPEAMPQSIVDEVMRRYDIDELNVIDERGVVVAGAIADVGYDMASNPKSAEFNRLLDGVETFSQKFRGAIENPGLRRKYVGVAFPPPAKGYIQIGFSESRVRDGIDYWFADIARGWHVGETGFYVVAKAETGEIDSCGIDLPPGVDTLAVLGFDAATAPADPKTFFTATLAGRRCLCLSEVECFHRIITAIPVEELRDGLLRATVIVGLALFAVLALAVVFMNRLADLVASLKGYIEAEKGRQEKEFAVARVVQASSLPLVFPDTPAYRVFARMTTAKEVGGDFYDCYRLASGRLLVLVADVSGKGISAALFMMKARSIIKACVFAFPDLATAVAEANSRLSRHNDAEMFVTAWIGVYDPATGRVDYVNAGHNPPLVRRSDGSVEWLRARPSLVLAAMDGVPYAVRSFALRPGDGLLLYTDGVTEAMNAEGELFGEARLAAALAAADGDFVTAIEASLHAFVRRAEPSDDITMLALDCRATEAG